MNMSSLNEIEHNEPVNAAHLPRWNELPDLDIYMDQVISLIGRYFQNFPGIGEKSLTSSMVNNYVKLEIIPPPTKKKYNKVHLAYLVILCVLKTVIPIPMIRDLIASTVIDSTSYETLYNRFCDNFESAVASARSTVESMLDRKTSVSDLAFFSAIRSHSEQAIALQLIRFMTAEEESKA